MPFPMPAPQTGLRCSRFNRRRLRRRRRAALHAIAERAQDRGEILAGRTRERRHRLRHHEAAAIERAGGLFARRGLAPRQRRTNEIGEPLQNIDPHRALAALPIAQHAIGVAVERLVDGKRGAAAARQMLRARQRRHIDIVLFLRPQQRRQRARRGLQQRRDVDMIGAEPHAVFAQRCPRRLIEILHLGRDLLRAPARRALRSAETRCRARCR